MAKQDRDSIREQVPGAAEREAAVKEHPAPAVTDPELRAALIALANSQAATNINLAGIVGDREKYIKDERADIERSNRIKAEASKPAVQRTQEAADKKWPKAGNRFRAALMCIRNVPDPMAIGGRRKATVPDNAFPVVDLNADSPEEARERYRIICGIRSTDHEIVATPMQDVEASKLAGSGDSEWDAIERASRARDANLQSQGVQELALQ